MYKSCKCLMTNIVPSESVSHVHHGENSGNFNTGAEMIMKGLILYKLLDLSISAILIII